VGQGGSELEARGSEGALLKRAVLCSECLALIPGNWVGRTVVTSSLGDNPALASLPNEDVRTLLMLVERARVALDKPRVIPTETVKALAEMRVRLRSLIQTEDGHPDWLAKSAEYRRLSAILERPIVIELEGADRHRFLSRVRVQLWRSELRRGIASWLRERDPALTNEPDDSERLRNAVEDQLQLARGIGSSMAHARTQFE
jgi:hypothetical protein